MIDTNIHLWYYSVMRDKSKFNEWHRQRRQYLKDKGLCWSCGNSHPRDGYTLCADCSEKRRQSQQRCIEKKKAECKQKGLCNCGNPPENGRKSCNECYEKWSNRYKERIAKGICCNCPKPLLPPHKCCKECMEKSRRKIQQLRSEVFAAYGGAKCNCCGETIDRFLTLDHVNNDGKEHRKQVGRTSVLRWLKDNDYPEGYQVLCFNCNMGRQLNGGICPHKQ